jgi:hypothetical protein
VTRWRAGEAEVEALLAAGELERVSGAAADGDPWLAQAQRSLGSAAALAGLDPVNAFSVAYTAVREAAPGCSCSRA